MTFQDIPKKKHFKERICPKCGKNLKQTDTHTQLKENALTANKKYKKFCLKLKFSLKING